MTVLRGMIDRFGRTPIAAASADACMATCEATLPSSTAVDRLLGGEAWAIPAVVMSTVLRGALISTGLYVAGYRGMDLAKGGIAGALAIETFVIAYVAACRIKDARAREEKLAQVAALHGVPGLDWGVVEQAAREMGQLAA